MVKIIIQNLINKTINSKAILKPFSKDLKIVSLDTRQSLSCRIQKKRTTVPFSRFLLSVVSLLPFMPAVNAALVVCAATQALGKDTSGTHIVVSGIGVVRADGGGGITPLMGVSGTLFINSELFISPGDSLRIVNGGRVILGDNGSIGKAGNVTIIGANANGEKSALEFLRETKDYTYDCPISGDGNIVKNGAAKVTLGGENPFTGDIFVNDGALVIVGGLGAGDSFGTPAYEGNIYIAENANMAFSSSNNAQVLAGALSGGGTMVVNSGQHLYYIGTGVDFIGTVDVSNGHFHLPGATDVAGHPAEFGKSGVGATVNVAAGSGLYVGNNGTLNASALGMSPESRLNIAPGGYQVRVSNPSDITLAKNIAIVLGKDAPNTASLSFVNPATGQLYVTNGVVLPSVADGAKIHLDISSWGYFPTKNLASIILMDGLDTKSIVTAFGNDMEAAIKTLFDNDDFYVLASHFKLLFRDHQLVLQQLDYVHVPEPSTYSLVVGIAALGFVLLTRLKGRKR